MPRVVSGSIIVFQGSLQQAEVMRTLDPIRANLRLIAAVLIWVSGWSMLYLPALANDVDPDAWTRKTLENGRISYVTKSKRILSGLWVNAGEMTDVVISLPDQQSQRGKITAKFLSFEGNIRSLLDALLPITLDPCQDIPKESSRLIARDFSTTADTDAMAFPNSPVETAHFKYLEIGAQTMLRGQDCILKGHLVGKDFSVLSADGSRLLIERISVRVVFPTALNHAASATVRLGDISVFLPDGSKALELKAAFVGFSANAEQRTSLAAKELSTDESGVVVASITDLSVFDVWGASLFGHVNFLLSVDKGRVRSDLRANLIGLGWGTMRLDIHFPASFKLPISNAFLPKFVSFAALQLAEVRWRSLGLSSTLEALGLPQPQVIIDTASSRVARLLPLRSSVILATAVVATNWLSNSTRKSMVMRARPVPPARLIDIATTMLLNPNELVKRLGFASSIPE